MEKDKEIASMYKVGYHLDRIKDYLNGNDIFPVTLELDLTSQCTRFCPDCPSVRASGQHDLPEPSIRNLFSLLEGRTRGLLLTGGEPTASPLFPRALEWARQAGFEETAVVTNGSNLESPPVWESLLRFASTIRLSLYDWENDTCGSFVSSLRRMESLRKKIDENRSGLQIGVSALNSDKRSEKLEFLAQAVRSAGADWIYFHPLCKNWYMGTPIPEAQSGVVAAVEKIQSSPQFKNRVFLSAERYKTFPLEFNGYHAAHFLLVVGADGLNYLGPEVKYQPEFAVADMNGCSNKNFLWNRSRFDKIGSYQSRTYSAIKSRHRGILYNHLIECLKNGNGSSCSNVEWPSRRNFHFPYIL